MIENCGSCAFAVSTHGYKEFDCHRHAPRSFEVVTGWYDGGQQRGPRPYFPAMKENDFCGDWELRDAK